MASYNKIGYLTPAIANLKALESLDLSYNQLTTLPFTLAELEKVPPTIFAVSFTLFVVCFCLF